MIVGIGYGRNDCIRLIFYDWLIRTENADENHQPAVQKLLSILY